MVLAISELKNLPVLTEKGMQVGHAIDFEIDVETQAIINLIVRRGLLGKTLVVHRSQIKSISKEKIIVDDAAIDVLVKEVTDKQYESPAVNY